MQEFLVIFFLIVGTVSMAVMFVLSLSLLGEGAPPAPSQADVNVGPPLP